jgi:Domain of unknown function (DUF397)
VLDPYPGTWRKSSYSGNGNECVEVADNLADSSGFVLVRDTKDRTGPVLRFPRHHWEAFTAAVRADEFGH